MSEGPVWRQWWPKRQRGGRGPEREWLWQARPLQLADQIAPLAPLLAPPEHGMRTMPRAQTTAVPWRPNPDDHQPFPQSGRRGSRSGRSSPSDMNMNGTELATKAMRQAPLELSGGGTPLPPPRRPCKASQAPPRWTWGCRTPLTLGDPGAVNPDTLLYFTPPAREQRSGCWWAICRLDAEHSLSPKCSCSGRGAQRFRTMSILAVLSHSIPSPPPPPQRALLCFSFRAACSMQSHGIIHYGMRRCSNQPQAKPRGRVPGSNSAPPPPPPPGARPPEHLHGQ